MAGKGNRLKDQQREEPEIIEIDEKVKAEKKKPQRQKLPEKKKGNRFIDFLKDERTHKISGLMLIVLAVFLLIAFISYFFTWKNDQSYVTGSWFDLMRYITLIIFPCKEIGDKSNQ